MADQTEAQQVAQLAFQAAGSETLEAGKIYGMSNGDGGVHIVDTMAYLGRPLHKTGVKQVRDVESFKEYLDKHGEQAETEVTTHQDERTISAMIDAGTDIAAGRKEHGVKLTLKLTTEWSQWVQMSGKLMAQETFAEFIEDHAAQITSPASAEIMEIAATLQVKRGVEFEQGTSLSTGETQFTFREQDKASAGKAGQLSVPNELALALTPFKGGIAYRVVAKFRYRLRGSELLLGYKLLDVEKIQEDAFGGIAETVKEHAEASGFLFLNA